MDISYGRDSGFVAAGAVVGFLCGYLLRRHLSMVRFESRVEAEVADVKAHYRAMANLAGKGSHPSQIGRQVTSALETADGDATAVGDDGTPYSSADPAREGTRAGHRTAYHKIRSGQDDGVLNSEQPERDAGEDGEGSTAAEEGEDASGYDADFFSSRDTTKPYPITPGEFSEEHADWQKLTLTYYKADEVLTDDKDIPIREVVATIGPRGLEFGLQSDDENIVYIRNEHLEVDFEVTRDWRSYSEHVLGYGNPRLAARAKQGQL